MTVEALDHVNIVTTDLDRAETFYVTLLRLEERPAPAPLTRDLARWLHDTSGRAVIHLNGLAMVRAFDRDMTAGPTGALHHVALRCAGYKEVRARAEAMGLDHQCNEVPSAGLSQIFVTDPDGVLLELNFFGD